MTTRFIPFDGIANFRDVGGYRTSSGQQTKWKTVFRSGHLSDASDTDRDRLRELSIGEIHDFRRHEERHRYPTPPFRQSTTTLYNLRMGSARGFFEAIESGTATREATHQMMVDGYRSYITDHAEDFGSLLKDLATQAPHAVLLHCTAGKDRTGIGIALLLMALGVPRDTIVDDYLLSAEGYPPEEIIAILEHFLAKRDVPPWDREALVPYCGVHEDFINTALDTVDQLGGPMAYFKNQLKLADSDMETLQARFLEA